MHAHQSGLSRCLFRALSSNSPTSVAVHASSHAKTQPVTILLLPSVCGSTCFEPCGNATRATAVFCCSCSSACTLEPVAPVSLALGSSSCACTSTFDRCDLDVHAPITMWLAVWGQRPESMELASGNISACAPLPQGQPCPVATHAKPVPSFQVTGP